MHYKKLVKAIKNINEYLLNTNHVPGTILGTEGKTVGLEGGVRRKKKKIDKIIQFSGVSIQEGMSDNK